MPNVVMPRLAESMEEGTILRWLKSDGDRVARGDELVEIETDKATMTYEAEADGVLEVVAGEGDTLAVGQVIATLGEGARGGDGGGGTGQRDAGGGRGGGRGRRRRPRRQRAGSRRRRRRCGRAGDQRAG